MQSDDRLTTYSTSIAAAQLVSVPPRRREGPQHVVTDLFLHRADIKTHHRFECDLYVFARRRYHRRMGMFQQIRQLASAGDYVVTRHAAERLRQRGIMTWQAVVGLDDGKLLAERPTATPFPVIEVRETLPDGTEFKAVWSLVKELPLARLVTVHFFD